MALTRPFAQNGDKLAIPETASDSSVSYNLGFTYAYALPPEEGGKFIDRAQFNQLMYDTTSQVLANKTAIATKANTSEVVKLTTNQNIQGIKTFSVPPVSETNPKNNNQVANKAYVDSVANTKVATTTYNADKATFATKTELNTKANANATVNLTGNQPIGGVKTFSSPPVSATNPTANNQVANKAYVDTVGNTAVKLKGDQSIAGVKTFTSNIVSPNITAMQNNLNTIFSSTSSPVKVQTTTKVIEVGTGGDFQDLLSAIAEARKYTSRVEIRFLSDLRTTNNITILNLNALNIVINFNNFKLINTNSENFYTFGLTQSSIGSITNLSLEGYVFAAVNNSNVVLTENITINNSQYEIADCVRAWFGSTISINDNSVMTLSHGGQRSSLYSSVGSIIGIGGGSTINDNSADGFVFNAYRGGIIQSTAVTINNTGGAAIANQAANTPTSNGIIFGNYSL